MTKPTQLPKQILLLLLALSCLSAAVGCRRKPAPLAVFPAGSPKVRLDGPEIGMLGHLSGPYLFMKAVSPTVVQLTNTRAQSEDFKLIGLDDDLFVNPEADKKKDDKKEEKKEDPAAVEKRRVAIRDYKMAALEKLFGKSEIWILRMSKQTPAQAYLFLPDEQQTEGKPAHGEAILINALALRMGQANLDLVTPGVMTQPMFSMMLDCQLAGLIDAKNNKNNGDDLWTKFQMKLPDNSYDDQLADLEKRM